MSICNGLCMRRYEENVFLDVIHHFDFMAPYDGGKTISYLPVVFVFNLIY